MEGILDLENEKKFIKNKEHLSKEDYERLGEIETELKKLGKEIRDAFKREKYVPDNNVGKWIPVSERLPEKDVEVLATTESGYVTIAERLEHNHWFIHEGSTNAHTDDLIAWMPLPEPYSESEVE